MLSCSSCVQLIFDPMNCSPPGCSVHRILQARILEWVAMPSSRGCSRPRDWTHVSCIGRQILSLPPPGKPAKVVGAVKLHWRLKTKLNTKMRVIQPLPILLCGQATLNLINLVVAKAHNEWAPQRGLCPAVAICTNGCLWICIER